MLKLSAGLTAGLVLLAAGLYFVASVRTAGDWMVSVAWEDLPEVSGLVVQDGNVFASLELREQDGRILLVSRPERPAVVTGLRKPDGLALSTGNIVYTQESGWRPVHEIVDGDIIPLFEVFAAEGIDSASNGDLYVIEDRPRGRLFRYDRARGVLEVLLAGLEWGEGVCIMADRDVYFTEKLKGTISRLENGRASVVLEGLEKPGFVYCDEQRGGLWITEDRTNFGRLLFLADGTRQARVVASGLRSPQSIAFDTGGDLLLAEQGRDRILRLTYLGGDN